MAATPTSQHDRFLALYQPMHERLARFCQAVERDPEQARDLLQDTLVVAWEKFASLRSEAAFLHFLFGIAGNLHHKRVRRKKFWGRFRQDHAEQRPDGAPTPEQSLEIRLLYEALEQLPKAQREALILFEISGFSVKEVAAIQGTGLSAVKSRLSRGRQQLARLLEHPVGGTNAAPPVQPIIQRP